MAEGEHQSMRDGVLFSDVAGPIVGDKSPCVKQREGGQRGASIFWSTLRYGVIHPEGGDR